MRVNPTRSYLLCLIIFGCTLNWASLSSVRRITDGQLRELNLQIQGYSPNQNDDYVAISMKAEPGYIEKFEPFANAERVHHMLLYGCDSPAEQRSSFWRGGATCAGSSHILWAWARNAPAFVLPPNVAFSIGHDGDPVQYLVLQIHYARPFAGNVKDWSGVSIHISERRPKYLAGVYLFVTGAPIPPHMPAFLSNMSCTYDSSAELHPFAFRTHTHAMGRVVSAYVKHSSNGEWTQIGKRNPQWPQLFQLTTPGMVIRRGDYLAAMCRFDSHDKDAYTPMGSMGKDEMCNFYMMFYREADGEDPFPYGAGCFGGANPQLMADYPVEGTTLLPSHPEWEHMAHQSSKSFGVIERSRITAVGDQRLGQVAGLAFDHEGRLVVFHRADRIWDARTFDGFNVLNDKSPIRTPTLLVASAKGKELRLEGKYGENSFYLPHGIFVDTAGDYYTTDVGSHQVVRWQIESGKLRKVWAFGQQFTPGSDQAHLCKPAGVAVSSINGDVFIADGYCNNRVIKLTRDGSFSLQWGHSSYQSTREGARLDLGFFTLPHDISLDEANRRIYLADRENGRVQVFGENGEAKYEIRHPAYYPTVYSTHFCKAHGLFFIPGTAIPDGRNTIEAYMVPHNSTKLQYSFSPTSDSFKRPHIISYRVRHEDIWVGEIDEQGGVLWHFQLQTEDKNGDEHQTMHPMQPLFGNAEPSSIFEEESGIRDSTIIVVLNLLLLAFVMGVCYFSLRCCCNICAKRENGNRSSHTGIDRSGFKPLRTNDALSTEDESAEEEDEVIAHSMLKGQGKNVIP